MRPALAPTSRLKHCSCVYVCMYAHVLRYLTGSQCDMHSQQSEDGVGTPEAGGYSSDLSSSNPTILGEWSLHHLCSIRGC